MNYKNHAIAGLIAGSVVGTTMEYLDYESKIAMTVFVSVLIGSLAPDIDTASIPSRWAARISFVAILVSWRNNFHDVGFLVGAGFTLLKTGKHRGFTHKYSLPAILLVSIIWFDHIAIIGFLGGLIVHYALDSMNPFNLKNWI